MQHIVVRYWGYSSEQKRDKALFSLTLHSNWRRQNKQTDEYIMGHAVKGTKKENRAG